MKTEEVMLDGKKVDVVVDFDDSLFEEVFVEADENTLEDTTDLSKTIELVIGELHEQNTRNE